MRLSGTPWVDLRMSIDNRDDANLTAVLVDYGPGTPEMVTRGWLDPQNRGGVTRSRPIRRGREYRFSWDLQPDDHVFAAGTASASSSSRPTTTTRCAPARAPASRSTRATAGSACRSSEGRSRIRPTGG